jgi:hypothetical protein
LGLSKQSIKAKAILFALRLLPLFNLLIILTLDAVRTKALILVLRLCRVLCSACPAVKFSRNVVLEQVNCHLKGIEETVIGRVDSLLRLVSGVSQKGILWLLFLDLC